MENSLGSEEITMILEQDDNLKGQKLKKVSGFCSEVMISDINSEYSPYEQPIYSSNNY